MEVVDEVQSDIETADGDGQDFVHKDVEGAALDAATEFVECELPPTGGEVLRIFLLDELDVEMGHAQAEV
ncbi:hypothetical protein L596_017723 [Steinernema carpocapsae]|uniref:Uncharacterized protein n=1 Tax=Steinernema carpocapsae TaxID=34508 RepID=A0A4U5N2H0_STECR|nr:hypothetical protein L596_017723 [Steinernema carpocapsae]